MKTQLNIPDRIKVGYQKRGDTYTGQLAYVVYFDNKGVLRKEQSWEGWRDKKIEANEFENKPISGFVLNKGVGGQRESYGWNARNEYIRIYDPRNFEFEISVANLLFILREANCHKGKGLEGEFVYAWDGKDLVLLPTTSAEYQNSVVFTELKTKKVAAKELIIGATYETKDQQKVVYLGQFINFHYSPYSSDTRVNAVVDRQYVYYKTKFKGDRYDSPFLNVDNMQQIAQLIDPTPVANYAELVDLLNTQQNFGAYEAFQTNEIHGLKGEYDYWSVRGKNDEYKPNALMYKQLSTNSFAEYQPILTDVHEKRDSGGWYRSGYSYKKVKFHQTRIVTFNEDGTIDLKTKNVKDDTLYKIGEVGSLEFLNLYIKIKNSKKLLQFSNNVY